MQVVEDGYEFFAKRQLVTLFSAPNYCGEFDNAGAMMSVDETLLCSFQVSCALLIYWCHLTRSTCVDIKASGEKSEVPLWRDEHGSTINTPAQAKEEGRQDGLRAENASAEADQLLFALSLPHLYRLLPFHSFPSISLCFAVRCCD